MCHVYRIRFRMMSIVEFPPKCSETHTKVVLAKLTIIGDVFEDRGNHLTYVFRLISRSLISVLVVAPPVLTNYLNKEVSFNNFAPVVGPDL